MSKNKYLFLIGFFFLFLPAMAQYQGPVPGISDGYGSDGGFNVGHDEFASPLWPGQNVSVYFPEGMTAPVPVIFFAHGYNAVLPVIYSYFLEHLASRGYAVVFSPYPGSAVPVSEEGILERYDIMWEGFSEAVALYPDILDVSRIGFIGHSFGGGALPSMALRAEALDWGTNGSFLMPLAPWYFFDITREQLESFPENTCLLMQVYEADNVNDHRMAVDVFENIAIPDEEKDYIVVHCDTVENYQYTAGHVVPETLGIFDALDSYGVFRLADALADYAFTGNQDAKNVALGNGSAAQVDMGPIRPLTVSDDPAPLHDQPYYLFRCDNPINPRAEYCASISISQYGDPVFVQLFPNPAGDVLFIQWSGLTCGNMAIRLFDIGGRIVLKQTVAVSGTVSLKVGDIPEGMYFLQIICNEVVVSKKIIID